MVRFLPSTHSGGCLGNGLFVSLVSWWGARPFAIWYTRQCCDSIKIPFTAIYFSGGNHHVLWWPIIQPFSFPLCACAWVFVFLCALPLFHNTRATWELCTYQTLKAERFLSCIAKSISRLRSVRNMLANMLNFSISSGSTRTRACFNAQPVIRWKNILRHFRLNPSLKLNTNPCRNVYFVTLTVS